MFFLKSAGEALLVPGIILVSWSLLSAFELVNPFLVPSPAEVFIAAAELIRTGYLGEHILVSLGRVLWGYAISVAFALPLAVVIYFHVRLRRLLNGVLEFFRVVPPLAMIPLLILWFGIGEASKTALIVLATFFPIFLNALGGFEGIDNRWLELSKSLELSFYRHLRYVLFPGALPQIVTGLRLAFGFGWRALVGAELFAAASGLGYLIIDAQDMARVDIVYVGIFTIGFLGLISDHLLRALADAVTPESEARKWGINV